MERLYASPSQHPQLWCQNSTLVTNKSLTLRYADLCPALGRLYGHFRKTPNNLWTAGPIVFVGGFNPLDQSSQGSQSYRKKSNNCETLTTYRAIDDLIKVYKTDKNILYDCIPDLQSHGRPLEANTTPCCSARPAIARTAHRRRVLSPGRAGNARLEWRGTRTAMAPSMEGNEGGAPSTVLPKVGWFMYVYVKRYMEVLARRHAAFHCSGRSIRITPSDATREPYRPPCFGLPCWVW